jgi:hypothetical protein
MVEFIRGLRRTTLESKRRPRTAEIVFLERCSYRGEVTRDQPVDNEEDEEGDDERFYRLTNQDDRRSVEKPAIDLIECGFDHESTEQLLGAAIRIKNFEFAPCGRRCLMETRGHHERGVLIDDLAQFDVADIREVGNPVDLQLKLARIHSPEPVTQTLSIAVINFGHPLIDHSNTAAIVEVELRQCQEQRDQRAEEKDADEKEPPNSAAEDGQSAPCGGNMPPRKRPTIGLVVVLAGVRCLRLQTNPAKLALRNFHKGRRPYAVGLYAKSRQLHKISHGSGFGSIEYTCRATMVTCRCAETRLASTSEPAPSDGCNRLWCY